MAEPFLLAPAPAPELVFGLVAPVGADLDLVADVLTQTLKEMKYQAHGFRLTKLMNEIPTGKSIVDTPYVNSYKSRIAYANDVRRLLGNDALAALAISAIRQFRLEEWQRRESLPGVPAEIRKDAASIMRRRNLPEAEGKRPEETPLPGQAYLIRQFKRPEEIALMRSVYGRQFIVVSAYSSSELRRRRIEERERQSRGGLISDVEAHRLAYELVAQDAKESQDKHGQNVRDAFPLADVFIDTTSRSLCEASVKRFVHLIFGNNEISPTRDEYGMYIAKSASLRSSDLSRQVGAAIFRAEGEVVTMGCNEVPKAGGGTYWSEDLQDNRDFVVGYDPNERLKVELVVDLLDRLKRKDHLSEDLLAITDPYELGKLLLSDRSDDSISESKVMDLLEFGRIIHAEMSAICDASRKGVSIQSATLYCTTFPCHLCAKHIVASGIGRVVYLEPYPKSYASDLHRDSIQVEGDAKSQKVLFDPFIGVSPFRYRDLFEKGKRKYGGGLAQRWNKGEMQPMIEVFHPSYFEAETHIVGSLRSRLKSIIDAANKGQIANLPTQSSANLPGSSGIVSQEPTEGG